MTGSLRARPPPPPPRPLAATTSASQQPRSGPPPQYLDIGHQQPQPRPRPMPPVTRTPPATSDSRDPGQRGGHNLSLRRDKPLAATFLAPTAMAGAAIVRRRSGGRCLGHRGHGDHKPPRHRASPAPLAPPTAMHCPDQHRLPHPTIPHLVPSRYTPPASVVLPRPIPFAFSCHDRSFPVPPRELLVL